MEARDAAKARRGRPTQATASLKSDTLSFAYDTAGAPYSVKYNGTTYYYITDLQGDVTAIVNGSGVSVAEYTYNACGEILSSTGTMSATLGALNPLRYRGYVYDAETGFYYLQSRYYDPGICRFINADEYASTGQGFVGCNMFAYCGNNPVVLRDEIGKLSSYCVMVADSGGCRDRVINITSLLDQAMQTNYSAFSEYYQENGFIKPSLYFADKVQPGGEWDFKTSWLLSPDYVYVYHGEQYRFDDIGNIHYGYVGSAIFSLETLQFMGGVVQIYAGTSHWDYSSTNFDDPRDQAMIAFGYDLARGSRS